jgi:hypothetical protein
MDLEVTFEDSALYAKPMVVPVRLQFVADDELIEYICRENEKDYQHIGKASDERVDVAPEILSKYVGIYETGSPGRSDYKVINVTFAGAELVIDRTPWLGKDKETLIPLSARNPSIFNS